MRLDIRRKKKKDSEESTWGAQEEQEEPQEKEPKVRTLNWPTVSIPKPNIGKVRIPGLLGLKRVCAAITLIINFACFLAIAPLQEGIGIFFLINSLFLLDYLWKTRRKALKL